MKVVRTFTGQSNTITDMVSRAAQLITVFWGSKSQHRDIKMFTLHGEMKVKFSQGQILKNLDEFVKKQEYAPVTRGPVIYC